ncbi:MAG: hypothetical protein ACI32N_07180 [Bulleidia sp.]
MKKINSTLSMKRVVRSLGLFVMIPVCARILNILVRQYDISLMTSFNVLGSILIIYDWNLFGLHYNRAKYNLDDTVLYTSIAYVLILLWTVFSLQTLHCRVIIPSGEVLAEYGYALPAMLVGYSFMEAVSISIGVKCATDHMKVNHNEAQIILTTGILAGIAMTFLFIPSLNPLTLMTTLLYNVILMILLSYFYNQTGSFIPGAMGFALVNLTIMIIALL